jgi:hypothetical protein
VSEEDEAMSDNDAYLNQSQRGWTCDGQRRGHAHLRQVDKYSTKNNRLALSGSNVISWRRERECGDVYPEGDDAMRAVFIFFLPFLRLYVWVNFVGVAAQLHRLACGGEFCGGGSTAAQAWRTATFGLYGFTESSKSDFL